MDPWMIFEKEVNARREGVDKKGSSSIASGQATILRLLFPKLNIPTCAHLLQLSFGMPLKAFLTGF